MAGALSGPEIFMIFILSQDQWDILQESMSSARCGVNSLVRGSNGGLKELYAAWRQDITRADNVLNEVFCQALFPSLAEAQRLAELTISFREVLK